MAALIAAIVIGVTLTEAAEKPTMDLRLGDGKGWAFLGGTWSEDANGVIRPRDKRNLHSRAFYTEKAFDDLTVDFEYNGNYREVGTGNAGLILRAGDGGHFYYVHFPWGGQQLRAIHFWGGIAKVSGDGYQRNLTFDYVPGVPSETDRWYKVRVTAKGPKISVTVDGRKAFEAVDETYKSGFVGLAGYGWYFFRNIRINGNEVKAPAWNPEVRIVQPGRDLPVKDRPMPSGCLAPNGDVPRIRPVDDPHQFGRDPVRAPLSAIRDQRQPRRRVELGRRDHHRLSRLGDGLHDRGRAGRRPLHLHELESGRAPAGPTGPRHPRRPATSEIASTTRPRPVTTDTNARRLPTHRRAARAHLPTFPLSHLLTFPPPQSNNTPNRRSEDSLPPTGERYCSAA